MSVPNDLKNIVKKPAEVESIDDCLEILVAWAERKYGKNFFVGPLEEFQSRYGKVNPEDDFYQARMNYFIEWCLLERPIKPGREQRTPSSEFFGEFSAEMTDADEKPSSLWRAFAAFRHGLFQILDSSDEMIEVRDLCLGDKFRVISKSGETMRFLKKKMIFQGFVFGLYDRRYLGQGIIIHPELAEPQLSKYFKQHHRLPRLAPAEITRVLAATNMRYLRMQHVNPAVIYQSISG